MEKDSCPCACTAITKKQSEKLQFRFFEKPKTPAYDRYVKTASASASKALKIFCEETVCEEQKTELKADFEEYPAQPLSIGEKLMAMLGLAKVSTVKKL